jgi:penicillin amidase
MRLLIRIGFGLLLLLAVAAVAGWWFIRSKNPVYEGSLSLNNLKQPVEVYFDAYAIPHIYAQNEEDAYRALGYLHAQERLFQMEMIRRVGAGRLAEILGPDLLGADKLFRTLGINSFAERQAGLFLSADTAAYQRATFAYIDGVNQYIETGPTPVEFTLIGIPKTPFTPEDLYRIVAFMAFGFAEGIVHDPLLQYIRDTYGDEYLSDLALQTPPDAVRIKSFTGQVRTGELTAALGRAVAGIRIPQFIGSNGWAIAGHRTASGSPILENDTHMGFAQPAVWYEAHIEYPGYSFYGHHLAGLPFGVLGQSRRHGWGITMFENDDTDFFVETVNPEDSTQVRFRDRWETLDTRKETIKVKGQDDVTLTVRVSRHGPIMNGLLDGMPDSGGKPVALSWVLHMADHPLVQTLYDLNHSKSLDHFRSGVARLAAPGLNIMYADKEGNIAWWAAAKLPIRPPHVNSKLFLDGSSGADEYLGFHDFSKNPQSVNPPWGYVYSANNQPDTVGGNYFPGYYYPKSRAGRIESLLRDEKKWTAEDVRQVNQDVVSLAAPGIAALLIEGAGAVSNDGEKAAIEQLRTWNGDHQRGDLAPGLYYVWLSFTLSDMMRDELGDTLFSQLMKYSLIKNSFEKLLGNENSPWWDNVQTEAKETRVAVVQGALTKTLRTLSDRYGSDPTAWTWERMHTLTHPHPLGQAEPLDKLFNVGPIGVPGGMEVINNLSFEPGDTTGHFHVGFGPALRKITDFADPENGITMSPTGQSGHRFSGHYADQAQAYAEGKFRKMMMNKEEITGRGRKLDLLPR